MNKAIIIKRNNQYCLHFQTHKSWQFTVTQDSSAVMMSFCFNIISISPSLISSDIFRNIFIWMLTNQNWILRSLVKILGMNFAVTWCIPESSVKIVWYEGMDFPVSSATSNTAIQWSPRTSFTWAIKQLFLDLEGWSNLCAIRRSLFYSKSPLT